jgi:hypothetical protein
MPELCRAATGYASALNHTVELAELSYVSNAHLSDGCTLVLAILIVRTCIISIVLQLQVR